MEFREIIKTNESKQNFLKGMIQFAKIDGVVTEEEVAYFMSAADSLGLNHNIVIEYIESNDSNISFETDLEKLLFMREAIQICYVDNRYDVKEKELVEKFSKDFEFSKEIVKTIENWVEDGMAWKKRGDDMLFSLSIDRKDG